MPPLVAQSLRASGYGDGRGHTHGAIEQLGAVEVSRLADAVDFLQQLVDFLLHLVAVGGVVIGAVGGATFATPQIKI